MPYTINVTTAKREEFIDITAKIQEVIFQEKAKKGIALVYCPHTTAALTINENADAAVKKDIIGHLSSLVPRLSRFSHSEGNSDAHIKSSLLSQSLSLIINDSEICLGQWQGVFFCEFDGPRQREVFIEIQKI